MIPVDARLFAASVQRIRQRLGDCPSVSHWRLRLDAREPAEAGDVLLLPAEDLGRDCCSRWLAQGAALLVATPDGAQVLVGSRRYPLTGTKSRDWLAALAAFLACGFEPQDALVLALAWRDGDASRADAWPQDLSCFPRVPGLPARPEAGFASCPDVLGVYPVLPSAAWVVQLLALGAATLQLRIKTASRQALAPAIRQCVAAGRRHAARVFINDHWQLALEAGAYGVHLGQEDLLTADVSAIAAAGLRLGLSTHGYYEILSALHFCPSYIALGTIFPTTTKQMPTAPQGLARLARYAALLKGVVPLVAIGGIDCSRLGAVVSTGVGGVGVVRALTEASDPAVAFNDLQQAFAAAGVSRCIP